MIKETSPTATTTVFPHYQIVKLRTRTGAKKSTAHLWHGNQIVTRNTYNARIVREWVKIYALHRKHNHNVSIVII